MALCPPEFLSSSKEASIGCFCWPDGWSDGLWEKVWENVETDSGKTKTTCTLELIVHLHLFLNRMLNMLLTSPRTDAMFIRCTLNKNPETFTIMKRKTGRQKNMSFFLSPVIKFGKPNDR